MLSAVELSPTHLFQRVAVALALGLLVGLQRERAESKLAGIRTFPLITAAGALAALISMHFGGGWVVAAGAIAVMVAFVTGNLMKMRDGDHDPGLTTEMAGLVMYILGAYCMVGHTAVALVVGGLVALLLHHRDLLHGLVNRIGARDLSAIMQFVLIALVILPILPDRTFGPFRVINPHKIWLMVVLIVGISLGGYVAYKLFGAAAGTLLGGILGGLISSTATSVSYARRTKDAPEAAPLAAVVIVIASAVSFARVIVEVAVVAPTKLGSMIAPLAAMLLFMSLLAAVAYVSGGRDKADLPEQGNPAELKSALVFGALYAAVILAVAITKHYFGNRGLFVVAVVSGLTDMDAITLSTAQFVHDGRLAPKTGWQVILTASLANTVFKAAVVCSLAHRRLAVRILLFFALVVAFGLAALFLWPDSWQLKNLNLSALTATRSS